MRTQIINNSKPKRKYIAYSEFEDTKAGVWRIASKDDREKFIPLAAALMKNYSEFLAAMLAAIVAWPLTSNFHLSNSSLNRQAWIGHVGCCHALNSPEEVTRLAWHTLNTAEQDLANQAADDAIRQWEGGFASCQKNLWE